MALLNLRRLLILCLLLALTTACAPQPIVPATQLATPALTPAPGKTRAPKSTPGPEAFPTSAFVPPTTAFNVILGRPTANSVAAGLYAQTDRQVAIAYGLSSGSYTTRTAPVDLRANVPQTVELAGLAPDTAYYYIVLSSGMVTGEHTFHTQRAPASTFTFTLDTDPHNRDPRFSGELYATTLANALGDRPDFHVNLGDTFMTEKVAPGSYAEAESTFADMRPYLGIIGAGAPLFLVNGNHEGEIGWLLQDRRHDLPLWSTQLRRLYYPNPVPNGFYSGSTTPDAALGGIRDGYYAWTWGDALFVVLDPFWYTATKPGAGDLNDNWNWTLGKGQYDWLKSTLETSAARFKFIFIHHLVGGAEEARGGIEYASLFEWGGYNADGYYGFDQHRPDWGKPIHQLLVENHVSAVFHGHDHVFVKQDLDGMVYQEVPQPSMTDYNNTRLAADYGYTHGDVLGSSGHLRVTVTPEGATVEYVRAYLPRDEKAGQKNGQVDYRYVLPPSAPVP